MKAVFLNIVAIGPAGIGMLIYMILVNLIVWFIIR